jgi:CBS domain containing-hemolysin-like protein
VRLWRAVLRQPWPRIAALLTEQSERGVRLRSVTPFFGVLTAMERQMIFRAFRLAEADLRQLGIPRQSTPP